MKSFALILTLLLSLFVSINSQQPDTIFTNSQTTNILNSLVPSSDGQYDIFSFDPNFNSNEMISILFNLTTNEFVNPDDQLIQLGCNRKLHVSVNGNLYCVDTNTNYFYQISAEPPWEIIDKWYLGFSNTDYNDWSDPFTSYMTFVQYINGVSVVNFTIFSMENNTFLDTFEVDFTQLVGPGFIIEGYFITEDIIGFGMNIQNESVDSQVWVHPIGSNQYTQLATYPQNNIHRIFSINNTASICMSGSQINSVDLATGSVNTMTFNQSIANIDRINNTHFTAAIGANIYLLTVDENQELVVATETFLGYYF